MLKDFFNKNKRVFAFSLASLLLAMAIIGVGIISTQDNASQMLNDSELQQQVVQVQEAVRNEILSTKDEIKYWIKEKESDSYATANKDNGGEYEKLVAFYSVDKEEYVLTKTYYKYNSIDGTLKVAKVTENLTTNEEADAVLHVDPYIDEAIKEIDTWEVVSENLENFAIDLTDFQENKQVSYEVKLKDTKVSFPTRDTVNVKSRITINSDLIVQKHHVTLLPKPSLKPSDELTNGLDFVVYNGMEYAPEFNDYLEEFVTIDRSSVTKAANAGTYTIVFKLKDKTLARWEDGTSGDVECKWTIHPKEVNLTWGKSTWEYDGKEHSTTCEIKDGVINGDVCGVVLTNNNIGPDVGYKVCRAKLNNSNYVIRSGFEKLTLTISKTTPSVGVTTIDGTYNGNPQELVKYEDLIGGRLKYYISTDDKRPSADNVNSSVCTITNAGTYHIWGKIVAESNNYKDTEVFYIGIATMKKSTDTMITISDKEYTGETLRGVVGKGVKIEGDVEATRAGQYIVYITPDDNHLWHDTGTNETREFTWAIEKAPSECEPPEIGDVGDEPGNNNNEDVGNELVYNGEDQALVTPGSTSAGKVVYSLDGENWSEDLPIGKDAGDYEIYYRSTGDENHTPSDPKTITVTIARARTAKVVPQDKIYNGEEQNGYSDCSNVILSYDHTKTNAREYTFIAVPDSNHAWEDGTYDERKFTWVMNKADGECNAPTKQELSYNGKAQTLIKAGSTPYGEMLYKLGESGEWSKELPEATDIGEYKIYYYSTGDKNHEPTSQEDCVTAIIKDSKTNVTVNHWQQRINGEDAQSADNFELKDIETFACVAGESITPTVKYYEGFTAPGNKTVTIADDGSTVIDYYYTRNSYKVTLIAGNEFIGFSMSSGNKWNEMMWNKLLGGATVDTHEFSLDWQYGSNVTIDAKLRNGYLWNSWTGTYNTEYKCHSFVMPAHDVTMTANAIVQTASYTVNHWQQDIGAGEDQNDINFNLENSETFTGAVNTVVSPELKDYDGFTAPSAKFVRITADGSTTVDYYYTRNSYKVTLTAGLGFAGLNIFGDNKWGGIIWNKQLGGVPDDDIHQVSLDLPYDTDVTIDAQLLNYYNWDGWTGAYNTTTQQYTFKMPAHDVTMTANAIVQTASYTVNHWQQDIGAGEDQNDINFNLENSETFTGAVNTVVSPELKDYEGFTAPSAKSVRIASDGSTVVDYYYTRNNYRVTIISGNGFVGLSVFGCGKGNGLIWDYPIGGGAIDPDTHQVSLCLPYEADVTISATLLNDYNWDKWTGAYNTTTQQYTFKMPAHDVTMTANAIIKTADYTVNHWTQKIGGGDGENDENYELESSKTFTDAVNTRVTPELEYYEGFTAPDSKTVRVASDGSTVVDYYYTRDKYTLNLSAEAGINNLFVYDSVGGDGTGGNIILPIERAVQYGDSVTISAEVYDEYSWNGWSGTYDAETKQYSFKMPAHDVTMTASATLN